MTKPWIHGSTESGIYGITDLRIDGAMDSWINGEGFYGITDLRIDGATDSRNYGVVECGER